VLELKQIIGKLTWSSIASVVYILVQAVVFLYLSHHLPASDFGIFTISVSSVLFGINIIENGLPQSLIQTGDPKEADYNAVLFLNFKTAIFYSIILIIIIAAIVLLWAEKPIVYPTVTLMPCLFLAAYNKVQLVGLQKELKFKSIAKVEVISSFVYLLSIVLAFYFHLGVWILIIAFLMKYISVFLLLHFFSYIFSGQFSSGQNDIREKHYNFGKYIQGEKTVTSILAYADVFIVTATLGVDVLGFYDVLKRIVLRPITLLYNGAEQLFYPLFVSSKSDSQSFLENYGNLNKLSVFIFINATCILYLCSPLIINLLPAVYAQYLSTLKLLCVFSAVVVIVNPIDILLYSFGQSKLFFKWILSYTVPLLLVIYFTSVNSLNMMLIGLIVFYIIIYAISYFALIRKTIIPFRSYFSVLAYSFIVYFLLWQIA